MGAQGFLGPEQQIGERQFEQRQHRFDGPDRRGGELRLRVRRRRLGKNR